MLHEWSRNIWSTIKNHKPFSQNIKYTWYWYILDIHYVLSSSLEWPAKGPFSLVLGLILILFNMRVFVLKTQIYLIALPRWISKMYHQIQGKFWTFIRMVDKVNFGLVLSHTFFPYVTILFSHQDVCNLTVWHIFTSSFGKLSTLCPLDTSETWPSVYLCLIFPSKYQTVPW